MVAPIDQDTQHKCEIFHCDKRGDRYCCFYCYRKNICHNPCKNNPKKCGQSFIQEAKNGR